MTYDRYQIELGVLQNSTIKSKQYKFMDMDTPYPYLVSPFRLILYDATW